MRALVLGYVKELVRVHVQDVPDLVRDAEVVIQVAADVLAHVVEIANPVVKDALLHALPLVELIVEAVALAAVLVVVDVLQDVRIPV